MEDKKKMEYDNGQLILDPDPVLEEQLDKACEEAIQAQRENYVSAVIAASLGPAFGDDDV